MNPAAILFPLVLSLLAICVIPAMGRAADNTEIHREIESTNTLAYHEAIAAYYDKQAEESSTGSSDTRKMRQEHQDDPKMVKQCDLTIRAYKTEARDDKELANPSRTAKEVQWATVRQNLEPELSLSARPSHTGARPLIGAGCVESQRRR